MGKIFFSFFIVKVIPSMPWQKTLAGSEIDFEILERYYKWGLDFFQRHVNQQ